MAAGQQPPLPQQAQRAPSGPVGGALSARPEYTDYKVIRRNGSVVGFEPAKVSIAMTKAFLAVNGGQGANSARVREIVETLTGSVVTSLMRRMP